MNSVECKTFANKAGVVYVDFVDANGTSCCLHESSCATELRVWLGRGANAMYLSQEHVRMLLPQLTHFVETGRLIPPGDIL